MNRYAVIDFETTGLSPSYGARPTEIAVVILQDGQITQRYQSLMNPGVPIPYDIQALTGITNAMVKKAPKVETVMQEAFDFAGDHALVAHNAAFDSKFWEAELSRIQCRSLQPFICSLLLSRRLFPESPNHKLATLVQTLRLPATGKYHRALADAEATAYLLLHIQQELQRRFELTEVSHELWQVVQKANKAQLEICIARHLGRGQEKPRPTSRRH